MTEKFILKVLVGSRSHGLNEENSDYDYRGVFVTSTNELLSLNNKYKEKIWLEGKEDQTGYEIGYFLKQCLIGHPLALEIFKAPIVTQVEEEKISSNDKFHGDHLRQYNWSKELIDIFPYVWDAQSVFNAFMNYCQNQRAKMLDEHLNRWEKYAIFYLRTLWNLEDLLTTETFNLEIIDTNFKKELIDIKEKKYTIGQVIDRARELELLCKVQLNKSKHTSDFNKVNNFLLKIRKEFWKS